MELTLSHDDGLLIVSWQQRRPKIELAMHRIGGRWHDFTSYEFPLELGMAREISKMAKSLKATLTITPQTKAELRAMRDESQEAKELSHANSDADVHPLLLSEAPKSARALRSYQRAGVEFMRRNESVLLADSPGAGKTLQTIATMISSDVQGDILVLAPSAAIQVTWPAEIERWAPNDEILKVTGARPAREAQLALLQRQSTKKRRWVLCNIEMAKTKYHEKFVDEDGTVVPSHYKHVYPELFYYDYSSKQKNHRLWAGIVVDESHRALITDKSQAYKQTQTRCGLTKLETAENAKRIAISGTPFRGKLENLWGTLNWLFPKKYTSYWKWIDRWFDTQTEYFGGTNVADIKDGQKTAFYEALAPFTLRRTKKEIAPDLPPKVYAGSIPDGVNVEPGEEAGLIGHWLEMAPKQKRAYNQMVEEAIANLDNGTLVANGVLAELTRMKQFATSYGTLDIVLDSDGYEIPKFCPALPSNKLTWLLEFLDELGIVKGAGAESEDDRKVVVASQFTSIIDLYAEALEKKGIKTLRITGKVKQADREAAVKSFQTNTGPQVLLLNTIAGGVSLTLDRADDLVILDETFIPDDQEQVEDRIHRVSRNHNVTIHYLRSLGTVEERIAKITHGRDDLQKQLLDGERGVDFARQVLTQ